MTCIKTGAHIFLRPYGAYALCDAFLINGSYIFRVVHFGYESIRPEVHFAVEEIAHWFDQYETGTNRASTMIVAFNKVHSNVS